VGARLVQVRECDGACCAEKPRFPNADRTHCRFWAGQCQLMADPSQIPGGESEVWPGRSAAEVFQETCVDWPQNSDPRDDLMGCCWRWVDGD
jgi:hypothetical protein